MAIHANAVTLANIDQVDTEKRFPLGSHFDVGNNAYVYVQGVTNGAANALVTFTSAGVTTLLAANAIGMVGVLKAALDATTKYGFVQVAAKAGDCSVSTDTVAANTVPYIDGTAGRIDDSAVAGDKVYNMIITSADTSNVATAWFDHPYVTNESN
jgi:hypothetical protein